MAKMRTALVSVLVSITAGEYRIVAVFARHQDAVQYADENNVQGWNVYERTFHAPDTGR